MAQNLYNKIIKGIILRFCHTLWWSYRNRYKRSEALALGDKGAWGKNNACIRLQAPERRAFWSAITNLLFSTSEHIDLTPAIFSGSKLLPWQNHMHIHMSKRCFLHFDGYWSHCLKDSDPHIGVTFPSTGVVSFEVQNRRSSRWYHTVRPLSLHFLPYFPSLNRHVYPSHVLPTEALWKCVLASMKSTLLLEQEMLTNTFSCMTLAVTDFPPPLLVPHHHHPTP